MAHQINYYTDGASMTNDTENDNKVLSANNRRIRFCDATNGRQRETEGSYKPPSILLDSQYSGQQQQDPRWAEQQEQQREVLFSEADLKRNDADFLELAKEIPRKAGSLDFESGSAELKDSMNRCISTLWQCARRLYGRLAVSRGEYTNVCRTV